jgi:hypothetical protein
MKEVMSRWPLRRSSAMTPRAARSLPSSLRHCWRVRGPPRPPRGGRSRRLARSLREAGRITTSTLISRSDANHFRVSRQSFRNGRTRLPMRNAPHSQPLLGRRHALARSRSPRIDPPSTRRESLSWLIGPSGKGGKQIRQPHPQRIQRLADTVTARKARQYPPPGRFRE